MVFQVEPGVRVRRLGASSAPLRSVSVKTRPVPLSKVLFDKAFALAALVFFAPFLLIVALMILLTEGGPVVFGHERVGLNGRRFKCLKFRTMCLDADQRLAELLENDPAARAEWEASRKLRSDPRISRVGAVLRKTSLDELPQLWNVLRGDMSMVGPRPVVQDEAQYYGAYFADYMSVRPGVTGAWQVSGRSDTTYDERVALDVDYVHGRSFAGDIRIVLKTVAVILKRDGAR
jgi:exopolysaccharide production protein ExoY